MIHARAGRHLHRSVFKSDSTDKSDDMKSSYVHVCIYYEGQKKCFTGKLSLPLTPKMIYADCSAAFFMATHSQLHFLYLWQNRSPGMEYQQSLNPAFPLENCTWIPDSLPQLQVCTLQGFPGKSKLSLKTCLTPAVRFFSPVMTLSSCSTAIPNHALLWPASTNFSENAFENVAKGFICWYLPSAS